MDRHWTGIDEQGTFAIISHAHRPMHPSKPMRYFRTFSRFWAFVCALAFLPWMQVAMARPVVVPAPCCANMPGMPTMDSMSIGAAGQQAQVSSQDSARVERAFCQAACQDLNAAAPASTIKSFGIGPAALIQRVMLAPQVRPALLNWQIQRIEPPPPSRPSFLVARLQV